VRDQRRHLRMSIRVSRPTPTLVANCRRDGGAPRPGSPGRRCQPRTLRVYDQQLFLQTLSRFAVVLPAAFRRPADVSQLVWPRERIV
jgi:hypothetical protein